MKSDYTYTVYDGLIQIIDLDKGRASVTNNIENVVREICDKEQLQADQYMIIYRDSEGDWDGWEPKRGFIYLGEKSPDKALERYHALKLKHKHNNNETSKK